MKIKTINDVCDYLDNFYYQIDYDKDKKDKHLNRIGEIHKEIFLVADPVLFKNPEKVLSKMLVSHIENLIVKENWLYGKENDGKSTQWIIEWRMRPAYELPSLIRPEYDLQKSEKSGFGKVYARFSLYPKDALKEKE